MPGTPPCNVAASASSRARSRCSAACRCSAASGRRLGLVPPPLQLRPPARGGAGRLASASPSRHRQLARVRLAPSSASASACADPEAASAASSSSVPSSGASPSGRPATAARPAAGSRRRLVSCSSLASATCSAAASGLGLEPARSPTSASCARARACCSVPPAAATAASSGGAAVGQRSRLGAQGLAARSQRLDRLRFPLAVGRDLVASPLELGPRRDVAIALGAAGAQPLARPRQLRRHGPRPGVLAWSRSWLRRARASRSPCQLGSDLSGLARGALGRGQPRPQGVRGHEPVAQQAQRLGLPQLLAELAVAQGLAALL